MEVKVLAFGIAKDIFGSREITIQPGGETVEQLKMELEQRYPALKELASYMIAVNDEYATNHTTINVTDEIAIIPPVSGG